MNVELDVYLQDVPVGVIQIGTGDVSSFRLHPEYCDLYPRPVLGQYFEDDLERVHRGTVRLALWFANLLPEGPLRGLLARQLGVSEIRDWYLLAYLGEDLPGAVRVTPREPFAAHTADRGDASSAREQAPPQPLRFSLAGVQLKLSMLRTERGFTLPVHGEYGDWIVKLPDQRYARVPEVEYATMQWAKQAGIDVPDIELVSVGELGSLPAAIRRTHTTGQGLAIRRFDRVPDGQRIHQEDFAQILNLYPENKYDRYNYDTMAAILVQTCGETALDAFIDRLVFVALSGNADAHHKNWSLRYPDGITATMAPCYDQVATVLFIPDDSLALNLAKSKRFADVSSDSFRRLGRRLQRRLGRRLQRDPEAVAERARTAATRICDAWRTVYKDIPLDPKERAAIEAHWQQVPLRREA